MKPKTNSLGGGGKHNTDKPPSKQLKKNREDMDSQH